MKILRNDRFAFGAMGTFGRARLFESEGDREWSWEGFFLERPVFPWVPENARDIAAIPVGEYRIRRGVFHRGTADPSDDYSCLVFLDGEVKGRGRAKGDPGHVSGLKIHGGNTIRDSKGCPLVGDRIDFLRGYPAVLNSRTALANLVNLFGPDEEALHVVRELRTA